MVRRKKDSGFVAKAVFLIGLTLLLVPTSALAASAAGNEPGSQGVRPRIFFRPGASPLTQILGVDFNLLEGARARLTVTTDRPAEFKILQQGPTTVSLTLYKATIPPLLLRRLDTRYFEGAVKRIKAFEDPTRREVTLRVELREQVGYTATQNQSVLMVEFVPSRIPPPEVDLASRFKKKGGTDKPRGEGAKVPTPGEELDARARVYEATTQDYAGERMSFDFVDADIRNILRLIAEVAQINIVWGHDVQGKVSMKLDNVPWDQALEMILKPNGLTYQIEGDVLWVVPKSTLLDLEIKEKKRRGALLAEKRLQGIFEPKVLEYIMVKHRKVEDIFQLLVGGEGKPGVLDIESGKSEEKEEGEEEKGKKTKIETVDILLTYDASTNIIIANGVRSKVEKVREIIQKLDVPQKQVMIEARIVEATTSFAQELGVQWENVTYKTGDAAYTFSTNFPKFPSDTTIGFSFANSALTTIINARIGLAETRGKVNTLSAPRIITQDAAKAVIKQGTQIAVPSGKDDFGNIIFTLVDAVLELSVTPKITANNMVVMEIEVKDDYPDYANAQGENIPIKTKRAQTQMMVRTGDTVVIGGIYKEDRVTSRTSTPWLSEIPLLGWLFKHDVRNLDRTEILIFLTPRVITTSGNPIS